MTWQSPNSETLLDNWPDPVIVLDAQGTVTYGNTWAAQLFEVALPFPALSVLELLTQPERSRLNPLQWINKWADAPDSPELDYVYLTCRTASGQTRQLSVRVGRVSTDDGPAFIVTMHDMTRWQERLRNERDAHRVAAGLLAITADGVVIADENLRMTFVNEAALNMFGYAQKDLIGESLNKLVPPGQHEAHLKHIAAFAGGREPARLMGQRGAVNARHASGLIFQVEVSISRVNTHGVRAYCALIRQPAGTAHA